MLIAGAQKSNKHPGLLQISGIVVLFVFLPHNAVKIFTNKFHSFYFIKMINFKYKPWLDLGKLTPNNFRTCSPTGFELIVLFWKKITPQLLKRHLIENGGGTAQRLELKLDDKATAENSETFRKNGAKRWKRELARSTTKRPTFDWGPTTFGHVVRALSVLELRIRL